MMRPQLFNLFPMRVKGTYRVRTPLTRLSKTTDERAQDDLVPDNEEGE